MSAHWKSTPSYWCKFCSIYVRDTPLERKNHESSGKHQGSIQRNLRELQKGQQRELRDKQRAKDEVARLNGLVSGAKGASPVDDGSATKRAPAAAPVLSASAQRKAHAEQLAVLGVELPDELKTEVTGVGGWKTISERVVEDHNPLDVKTEEDSKDGIIRGVHKRKADDDEEEQVAATRRKAWGSSLKTYPGASGGDQDEGDLDALLSGVSKKVEVKKEESGGDGSEDVKPLVASLDGDAPTSAPVKQEGDAVESSAPPVVVFKKRKVKK